MAHQTQPFGAHVYPGASADVRPITPILSRNSIAAFNEALIPAETARSRHASYRTAYAEDIPQEMLALYTLEREAPILVSGQSRIILGRSEPDETPPTVDLTDLDGARLGVSRKHAIILYADDAYSIQDLDSTNGTWLNGDRLIPFRPYPLHSTDQFQLGQLKLAILFQRERPAERIAEARSPERLLLDAPHASPVTPHFLARMVGPFLEAVSSLQQVCDEALGAQPQPVEIDHIGAAQGGSSQVMVRCRGASAAIALMDRVISPWRDENSDLLQAVRDEPGNERWRQALQDAEVHLAMAALDGVAPDLSVASRLQFAARMLPVLDALVRSDLAARGCER